MPDHHMVINQIETSNLDITRYHTAVLDDIALTYGHRLLVNIEGGWVYEVGERDVFIGNLLTDAANSLILIDGKGNSHGFIDLVKHIHASKHCTIMGNSSACRLGVIQESDQLPVTSIGINSPDQAGNFLSESSGTVDYYFHLYYLLGF